MAGNNSKPTTIQKRRRLDALFDEGGLVRFNKGEDGQVEINGEPRDDDLSIWVSPPSPLQREMALREAQAARARAMLEARRESESSQYVVARSFLVNLEPDALIDYVLEIDETDRLTRARRDVLAEKEWEDFNTLRDAMRQFEEAGSPYDDEEWQPLLDRDAKFGEAVYERGNELREADREGLALMAREELEKRALDRRIENAGSSVFMKVYEDWMLYFACRDDEDHTQLFFDGVDDLKNAHEKVQEACSAKLNEFVADPAEAKNSQAAGSGSPSSVPPNEPETSPSSTQEESVGF
jgi:hypothetical protein